MADIGNHADLVRIVLSLRGDQNRMFGAPLNAQAWDLIFVLFLAGVEGRRVKSRDAAFIAGIDPEAGTRWIAYLRERGLVVNDVAGDEGCITLSSSATDKIETFVLRAQAAFRSA